MKIVKRTREQVFKRWVKALRSGEYQQTQNYLKNEEGFCCLGVLCDLAAKDGGHEWSKNDWGADSYMDEDSNFPVQINKFMKISATTLSKLITMNDDDEASFSEIADFIEKRYIKS